MNLYCDLCGKKIQMDGVTMSDLRDGYIVICSGCDSDTSKNEPFPDPPKEAV